MSVIERLASSLGRKDQTPNKDLAQEICDSRNEEQIAELVEGLQSGSKAVQSDCIAVFEYVGFTEPRLISRYVGTFLNLLSSKNNRMVWGAMIVLSSIALETADEIYANVDLIQKSVANGSVITVDNGISVLAKVSSAEKEYEVVLVPFLLEHLRQCRPKEVGQHAEKCVIAMNKRNKEEFAGVLSGRLDHLSAAQKTRVKRVLRKLNDL